MSEHQVTALPQELQCHLMSFLPTEALLWAVSLVSKSWHEMVGRGLSRLELAPLRWKVDDQRLVQVVRRCPHVTRLEVSRSDDITFPQLHNESLLMTNVTSSGITAMVDALLQSRMPERKGEGEEEEEEDEEDTGSSLLELRVSGYKLIDDEALVALSRLSQLRFLDLTFCLGVGDEGLRHISKGCRQMRALLLSGCSKVSDVGMKYIAEGLPNLRILHLSYCWKISDEGAKHISALSQLNDLQLLDLSDVTDEGIEAIAAGCGRIHSLNVGKTGDLGDRSVAAICRSLSALQRLNLSESFVTDEGLTLLRSLPRLTSLDLSKCHVISDNGVLPLKELSTLKELNLYGCMKLKAEGQKFFNQFMGLGLHTVSVPDIYRSIADQQLPSQLN